MTYAIANIVYGIDLTFERSELVEKLSQENRENFEDEPTHLGFTTDYSGNGEPPLWLGIKLGQFDECSTYHARVITKHLPISEKVQKQWEEKVANLDPEILKALLDQFGKNPDASGGLTLQPEVLIIWSSS